MDGVLLKGLRLVTEALPALAPFQGHVWEFEEEEKRKSKIVVFSDVERKQAELVVLLLMDTTPHFVTWNSFFN